MTAAHREAPPQRTGQRVQRHVAHIFAIGMSLGACIWSDANRPPVRLMGGGATPSAPRTELPPPDLKAHMRVSFWRAVNARDALIAGKLELAREAAHGLVMQDYAPLPDEWQPDVARLTRAAERVQGATNLQTAAEALGELALACGECHAKRRARPDELDSSGAETSARPSSPPEPLDERMQRHEQGMEQMWAGLTGPSERAWLAGSETMSAAALRPPKQLGRDLDETLNGRVLEVRDLARRARAGASWPERAKLYGALLGRCASCHDLVRPEGPR